MKLADVILQWLERYDLCLWAILFVLRARKEFKYYQLHQQIIIFWGPVVGLWITQVVVFGSLFLDLFSYSKIGT